MKLIKFKNLKGYEGKLVECQYVAGQPFVGIAISSHSIPDYFKSYWYPKEHPMFTVKGGNTPILNLCGFPLIIVRYPDNHQKRQLWSAKDNQFERKIFSAELLVDVHTGLVPPEWQSYEGPILAYRPQIGDQINVQHFNSLDGEIVWDFMSTIMSILEKEKIPLADMTFTFEKLKDYAENYCLSNTGLSQNYQGTEGQNVTLGAF